MKCPHCGEKIDICSVYGLSKRKLNIFKNIVLLIFIACSIYAPWYTNVMWCLKWGNDAALGTFFNTLYFFGAAIVFSYFSDKWWNIPFAIYMLLSFVSAFAGIFFEQSAFYEVINFFAMPTYLGFMIFGSQLVFCIVTLVFSALMLYLMGRKYVPKNIDSDNS